MRQIAALALMFACSGETTPAGPLGAEYDLKPLLPGALRSRAPADPAVHSGEVAVGAAKVLVHWSSFTDGASAYLLSMSFEVSQPADGLKLEATPAGAPVNRGTAEAVLQASLWHISWSRHQLGGTSSGVVSGDVLADGTLHLQR